MEETFHRLFFCKHSNWKSQIFHPLLHIPLSFVIIKHELSYFKSNERNCRMKSSIHTKFFCILLIVSMLALGMYCGEPLPSSPFSCAADSHTATLRVSDGVFNSHIYHEESKLTGLGEFTLARQNPRTVTVMRLNPLLVLLSLTGAFGLTVIFFTILSLQGFCRNQYRLRTLQYIHHKDGKKHYS